MDLSTGVINKTGIFLLLAVFPLIHLSNIFNPYESPKFVFFITVVAIFFLLNLKIILRKIAESKMDMLTKLVLIFGLVVYLADLLGIDPRTSFLGSQIRHQGFITLLAGIGLFFLVRYSCCRTERSEGSRDSSSVSRRTQNDMMVGGILLGGFLVSIFAIWQEIAFHIFHDLSIPTYQGRVVGTLGNPNSLAGYLVMILPFALFNKNNIVKIVLSLVILVTVILTDSRSAFLAVTILFLVYGVRWLLKLNVPKVARVLIMILILVGAIKFGDYAIHKNIVLNQVAVIKERGCPESWPTTYPLKSVSDLYKNKIFHTGREALCDNRLLIWVVGLETLSKRPILGFGQENFEIAVPPGKMHNADNAHNIFLETGVSSGLMGLLIFLGIIITAFKKTNFTIKMSLLAFLIVAQFNPLSVVEICLFWLLLAIDKKDLYM